jgi:ABC-type sugar transport system ATPase subunit
MNFLKARAAGSGERGTAFATDAAAGAVALVPGLSLTVATPVTLGFRPESVRVRAGADAGSPDRLTLAGRVETVERLGNINFAYVNVGGEVSVTVQMMGAVAFGHGDQVDLTVPVDEIHVFDDTGVRLKPDTPQTTRTSSMGGNWT